MSAQPGEELGSDGRWFGDDYERNGLFGNTPTRFDDLRDEFKPRGGEVAGDLDQQFHPFHQDDGKRPPVAMETASTDDPMTGLFRKPMNDDGDVYTSLTSNPSREASYLSDDLKPTKPSPGSSDLDPFSSDNYSFSSNTKMTSSLVDDMPKSMFGSDKTESYNYMDITHGDERRDQQSLVDTGSSGRDSLSFPYVEEPSDEELSDYRSYRNLGGTPQTASPVKITLTESQTPPPRQSRSRKPPWSARLSVKTSSVWAYRGFPLPSTKAGSREHDGSSAESGDSEIELVSEEPPKAASNPFSQPPKSKSPVSQPNNPFDNPPVAKGAFGQAGNHAPPTSYSILREEREAELDSDLFIESASEESPKREQGFSGPKQGASPPSPWCPVPPLPAVRLRLEDPSENRGGSPQQAQATHCCRAPRGENREAPQDDMHSDEGKGDLGKPAASSPLQGFDKQKGGTPPPLLSFCPWIKQLPLSLFSHGSRRCLLVESKDGVYINIPPLLASLRYTKDFQVLCCHTAAGSTEVKPAADSSHGNGPMFPADRRMPEEHRVGCNAIDLLYWRNVKQSGAVFSSVLLLLFSLTQFSMVSVGAYLALAALSASISFRIYKSVLQAVQKTDEGHPFKSYLEMEIALSQDQISKYADKILLYSNTCMKELRRLFLVQDLIDSLKFAVLMWLLTYVGALFNGLTLLILAVVSMFTMPVVYEKHQAQIDQYVGLIRTQVNSVVGKIQAKIPGAKRKEE
ncbi:hypothetical protein F7725_008035 [Dissostichus mawsoni]|uniref:Reticulon n=1 Tax=Dissostichus mawsoni TaxID=36200 RepID=A0A7J5Y612_DISMA|nr:hypothetical protein F7725_008035 [Dissostichus mawsoni]